MQKNSLSKEEQQIKKHLKSHYDIDVEVTIEESDLFSVKATETECKIYKSKNTTLTDIIMRLDLYYYKWR